MSDDEAKDNFRWWGNNRGWETLSSEDTSAFVSLTDEITRLRSLLPDGMDDCRIIFEQCEVGHGWLRGENWVKHDCPWCQIARLRAENERLREALKECEEELDGYYHQDYPTDHPYHQRKLKVALQGNPARAALKENSE